MSAGDELLKTLKRIRYPGVEYLEENDINLIVSEEELCVFLKVFNTLNENNVLTTEEVEEYAALTPEMLGEIENMKLPDGNIEHERRKEVLFLQEQLEHVVNHNKLIENHVDHFKKHEEKLIEEIGIQQNLQLDAKRIFKKYESTNIFEAEEEFVSHLVSILQVAEDIKSLIIKSDANDSKLPISNFFKDILQQYLNCERKLLHDVNIYLQNAFELQEDGTLTVVIKENSYRQEMRKEALFFEKTLKNSMLDKVLTEKEMQKYENMMKYFEVVKPSDFDYHSSQLRYKLEDSLKLNEHLKKKEQELEACIYETVCQHFNAFLAEIDLCVTNETYNNLQFYMDKLSLPVKILINQRARLEILIAFLNEHKQELQSIKDLIYKFVNLVKQEKLDIEKRKEYIESNVTNATTKKSMSNSEVERLSLLNKILEGVEGFDFFKLSESQLKESTVKLLEAKESCIKKSDFMEKHAYTMESLLNWIGEEYLNWHEMEQEIVANMNKLNVQLSELAKSSMEHTEDFEKNLKILEKKGNLRLARKLYLYALMNKDLFRKCIDDIKIAVQHASS